MKKRPSFAVSLASALRADAADRGWRAFFPTFGILSGVIGVGAAYFTPIAFWTTAQWDISTAVYGGLLAFNGLLLALGWSAFSRIYEIIANGKVGEVLRKHDLLSEHLAFVDANHATLVASASFSLVGLISVLMTLPLIADQAILGLSVGTIVYALIRAMASTKMMSDLVWEQAHLAETADRPLLRPVESLTR